ncbi:MAG: transposase [Acidobacteria bacterium]|nr:transposase [Acidobacteriota bacterium]
MERWQLRGLSIFYLPKSSPHLNIAEILWRKLRYRMVKSN